MENQELSYEQTKLIHDNMNYLFKKGYYNIKVTVINQQKVYLSFSDNKLWVFSIDFLSNFKDKYMKFNPTLSTDNNNKLYETMEDLIYD
jgi:hypothetical protein